VGGDPLTSVVHAASARATTADTHMTRVR
jgi:hypothetical protein